MGQRALTLCVDPVVEQTRDVALSLFAASLTQRNVGWRRSPADALSVWTDHALRTGDSGLARILDRLDYDTFAASWRDTTRRLDRHGVPATIEWLTRRITGGAG